MTQLYTYQQEAVAFALSTGGRCILGEDMGLGKTVEAIAVAEQLGMDTLVVCPASVLYKWQRDIKTWTGLDAELILNSTSPMPNGGHYHICSYAIMTRRYQDLIGHYPAIILDEFTAIKNFRSQRTRAAKRISVFAKYILMLSGTPFLNRPIELFNALHILDPKSWPSVHAYGNRYCGGLADGGLYMGATNLDELRTRLKDIMIRRLKSEVLEQLPSLTRTIIPVVIPNMREYNEVKAQVMQAIKEMDPDHKGYFVNALDKLNMLRQVVGKGKADAAIPLINDMMEQIGPNSKLVIYAHHQDIIASLAHNLMGHGVVTYTGGVDAKTRDYRLDIFRNPDGPRIMVVSSAGREGIDLFGKSGCDISRLLMIEREWNPSSESQIESRLHRIGQKNAVDVYYLSALKTIDEKFAALVEQKRRILQSVVGENVVKIVIADLLKEI